MTYQRRNRVLCLHGPSQSAASFRAALKPVCDALPRNWEFHFLDAPFIIADEDEEAMGASSRATSSQDTSSRWSQAAIDASLAVGLEAELKGRSEDQGRAEARSKIESELATIRERLASTTEGRKAWEAQQQMGGADAVEALLSTKVVKSMSRGWTVRRSNGELAGIDVGLDLIGDYMREQGTFRAVIGCDAGADLAILLQALLSYPRSSTQAFPSYFAQLPKGIVRLPRMGGWEEEPPAPDDPRLGDENLTKDYVPAQRPFEAVAAFRTSDGSRQDKQAHSLPSTSSIGARAAEWIETKQPLLRSSHDGFAIHSLSMQRHGSGRASQSVEVTRSCSPSDDMFDQASTSYLANWLKLAIASCGGDASATKQIGNLRRETEPQAKL